MQVSSTLFLFLFTFVPLKSCFSTALIAAIRIRQEYGLTGNFTLKEAKNILQKEHEGVEKKKPSITTPANADSGHSQ